MSNSTAASLVAEATARVESLVPADVAAELDGDVLLVDVREEDERLAHGVIAASVKAPEGCSSSGRILPAAAIGPSSTQSGGSFSTPHPASDRRWPPTRSRSWGTGEWLTPLAGGLQAWKEQGYPVQRVT